MSQQPVPEAQPRGSDGKQGELPDRVALLVTSLQIGAGAGACGTFAGAAAGIIRASPTPILFSFLTGFQWFGLSSVFYGTRELAIARIGPENTVTPNQKVKVSAMAGAASVIPVGLLVRGPRSILPGMAVFSLLGAGGQYAVNKWYASERPVKAKSSWLDSSWSPMERISDEKYATMLEEKLLKVETEIAMIDEDIAALKTQKAAEVTEQPSSTKPNDR